MHAWIWPRKIVLCGVVLVALIGFVWPNRVSSTEIVVYFSEMEHSWGQPIAFILIKTALTSLDTTIHLTLLEEWVGPHSVLKPSHLRFFVTLRLCAFAVWIGWMVLLMKLNLMFLCWINGGDHKTIRINADTQPWNQAQRWPLWRRATGLIPLITFFWVCGGFGGVELAPLFAAVWVALAFLLWWPFFKPSPS